MLFDLAVLVLLPAAVTVLLVGMLRAYAIRAEVLDRPNERSSHAVPVPRGGGAGLVLVPLIFTFGWALRHGTLRPALAAALAGAVAVAAVGWLDDHQSVSVRARFTVHLLAGVAIAWLALDGGNSALPWPLVAAWWAFWTISAINVVNFMDGIDGLIGSQVLLASAYLALMAPAGSVARVLATTLAAACFGFLLWNWAPARIFMGDVGSGTLGALVVLAGLLAMQAAGVGLVRVFLPLYPLFLDATVTLVKRRLRGERLTQAHRSHLYQRLANGGWGHARVSLLFLGAAATGAIIGTLARGELFLLLVVAYGATVAAGWFLLDRTVRGETPAAAAARA